MAAAFREGSCLGLVKNRYLKDVQQSLEWKGKPILPDDLVTRTVTCENQHGKANTEGNQRGGDKGDGFEKVKNQGNRV